MISTANALCRLALAGIFLIAGAAKLHDRDRFRLSLAGFGVPPRLVRLISVCLPVLEIATAILLLPAGTARLGATQALVLLLVFLAAIVTNLAVGRRPDCGCFGETIAQPIGPWTIARNVGLGALSLLVLLAPGPTPTLSSLVSFIGTAGFLAAAGGLALVLQTFVITELFRQHGRLMLRMDALEQGRVATEQRHPLPGLAVGAPIPVVAVAAGASATVPSLLDRGLPVFLVFSDPGCSSCIAVIADVKGWQRILADRITVAVVSRRPSSRQSIADLQELRHLLIQEDHEVSGAFGVQGTPAAVVLRPEGTIGSPLAYGRASVSSLLHSYADHYAPVVPDRMSAGSI